MLNVPESELKRYRQSNRRLLIVDLRAYLRSERSGWPFTRMVIAFGSSRSWRFAHDYRNRWVHEQPPSVEGEGIAYRRQLPWKISADGARKFLAFGSGDAPELRIADIREHLIEAYSSLWRLLDRASMLISTFSPAIR